MCLNAIKTGMKFKQDGISTLKIYVLMQSKTSMKFKQDGSVLIGVLVFSLSFV